MPERRKPRQPFWLSKAALAVFLLVFIICATSLIILNSVITSRNGLSLTISSSPYSWTYGPTAILIVVLSFWRRIDYYYKVRQPWHELLAGPSSSKNSLLLDYISSFQVVSLWQAVRRRHFPVAASIGGFFLIKFIILISTTLFVVMDTDSERFLNVSMQDHFDASRLWLSYQPAKFYEVDQLPFRGGASDSSVWTYLSRLNNVTTERSDWKLPEDLITQRYTFTTGESKISRVERPVDIFVPHVSCEDAALSTVERSNAGGIVSLNYTFTSETCTFRDMFVRPCRGARYGDPPSVNAGNRCPAEPHVYSAFRVNCTSGLETTGAREWPKDIEPFDIRYAISVADFKSTIERSGSFNMVSGMELIKSSALICKIDYGIATANATLDLQSGNVSLPMHALYGEHRLLGNLSSLALAELLWTNLARPAEAFIVDEKVPTVRPVVDGEGDLLPMPRAEDVLFQLIYAQLGRPGNLDAFYKTDTLKKATVSVLEGIAREFARESLLVAKPTRSSAKGWATDDRLHMRPVAIWTMVLSFFLLCIMCLSLFFQVPGRFEWIPAMSGSLAGSAAILAKSPELQSVLSGSSHLTSKELESKLVGIQFSATKKAGGDLEVQAVSSSESSREISPITSKELKKKYSWTPLSARIFMIIPTFTTPLIAIGILELLYHLLQREDHFVRINGDSTTLSYIIRISSTLAVFGIATMINNLDSTIVVFAPFANLRSGRTRPDQGILFHLLSVNPFLVMFKSLYRGQFGPALSSCATLIAGFLTIIVSGLWVPVTTLIVDHPSTAAAGNWDLSWFSEPTNDGGAAVDLNQLHYGGAKIPSGIWQEMVVPDISLSDDFDGTRSGANYTYSVMALEPVLSCTAITQSAISTTSFTYGTSASQGRINPVNGTRITVQPPKINPQCSNSSIKGYGNLTFGVELRMSQPFSIGKYFDLPQSTAGQVSADCPSIGILFGMVEPKGRTFKGNLTALLCSQTINQVPVSLEYNGNPALGIIENIQTQGNSTMVQNDNKASTLGYKLAGFWAETLLPFPGYNSMHTEYDPFFNHILFRPDGYQRSKLEGAKGEWLLIRAVEEDYNEYLRYAIHRNMRAGKKRSIGKFLSATKNDSSAESPQSITTGLYSANITHLIIDYTSKTILQFLLAIMTFFSLIGFLLVKIRGTLPRDPCSVGSTMSLLSDSQLCDPGAGILPEDAQHMNEKESIQALDGWVFSGDLIGNTAVEESERESK
ncbi:uncharacterized protein FIESC28_00362 [Fusarium coffeatum]|uniref:Uncharacterized protein n=1 Tax=Fusarium coffeatum TaxID=231269 RepID=A0A366SBS0_9HYPO|nr:uncharacterized protein FIESC28_00362 [Fusarium coffeatum]RBR26781.1 hypothetical protein FIESC28_00362 [Fusarium coffeatum]